MELLDKFYIVKLNTIEEFRALIKLFKQNIQKQMYYCRGQPSFRLGLSSSLERCVHKYLKFRNWYNPNHFKTYCARLEQISVDESCYIDDVLEITKNYSEKIQKETGLLAKFDNIHLFSGLRHLGAPSRFIDFTLDLETAFYFACNDILDEDNVAVWMINANPLLNNAEGILTVEQIGELNMGDAKDVFDMLANCESFPEDGLVSYHPWEDIFFSKRMKAQKGVMVFPKNLRRTWQEHLFKVEDPKIDSDFYLGDEIGIKLEFDLFLEELRNNNNHTKSVVYQIVIPKTLIPSVLSELSVTRTKLELSEDKPIYSNIQEDVKERIQHYLVRIPTREEFRGHLIVELSKDPEYRRLTNNTQRTLYIENLIKSRGSDKFLRLYPKDIEDMIDLVEHKTA